MPTNLAKHIHFQCIFGMRFSSFSHCSMYCDCATPSKLQYTVDNTLIYNYDLCLPNEKRLVDLHLMHKNKRHHEFQTDVARLEIARRREAQSR